MQGKHTLVEGKEAAGEHAEIETPRALQVPDDGDAPHDLQDDGGGGSVVGDREFGKVTELGADRVGAGERVVVQGGQFGSGSCSPKKDTAKALSLADGVPKPVRRLNRSLSMASSHPTVKALDFQRLWMDVNTCLHRRLSFWELQQGLRALRLRPPAIFTGEPLGVRSAGR